MKHRLAALVAAVALPSGSAFADTIVYGSFLPPAHGTNSVVMKEFAETVAQATNGATTIEIVTAGALSGARESLSSVANGALDATPLVYSYTPDDLPAHTFVGEIFTTDHRVAGPAATETILLGCPACRAEARAQGVRILTNPAGGSYHIMCRTSPVVTIGDINGRQMRTSGSNSDLMKSLGGAPVAMAYSEIYEALQRGALDCNLVAATELESSQMWDVTKYVTEISLGNFNSFTSFAINEDRWSALSDPAKSAIIAASAQALATDMNFVSEKIAKVREVAASEHGVEFVAPDPGLVQAVSEYRAGELATQIATARDRGVDEPEDIADYFAAASKKWTAIVARIGAEDEIWTADQKEMYARAIRTEIYDKLNLE